MKKWLEMDCYNELLVYLPTKIQFSIDLSEVYTKLVHNNHKGYL